MHQKMKRVQKVSREEKNLRGFRLNKVGTVPVEGMPSAHVRLWASLRIELSSNWRAPALSRAPEKKSEMWRCQALALQA